jgi:hypothetical protein
MARSKPNPIVRARIETGISLAAPLLDLLLAVGDRVSRVLGREEPDHVPARVTLGEYARRGLTVRDRGSSR